MKHLPPASAATAASPDSRRSPSDRWRAERNARARARLDRALPAVFPATVLRHALTQPLVPPTPRLAVESYWRAHLARADALARALAARSGAPAGWSWRLAGGAPVADAEPDAVAEDGLPFSFRAPPAPYREARFGRGRGFCRVCGQPAYRFGWHADLWGAGAPNPNVAWHAACVAAWKLWTQPSAHIRVLRKRQGFRCAATAKRLLLTAEVDHRTPLVQVWRDHRDAPWPTLLGFWGLPNLQVINRAVHGAKTVAEAADRRRVARPDCED